MASRESKTRNGHVTTNEFKTVKMIHNAKVIEKASGNNHGLPDYSHTPNRIYIKELKDGSFRELRAYNSDGYPILEIGYHIEPSITHNRKDSVLHYHIFGENLERSKAIELKNDSEIKQKYQIYLSEYGL